MTASFSTCGSLDSLPEELLVEILAAIPDVHSLWNLALTCRSLYSTVMNQGLRLPRKVFSSRIHERVIDLAFTAVDVRNNQGWLMGWLPNRRRVTRQDIAKGDETKPRHWDFRTILAMDQLHNTVEELTKWICSHVNLPGGQQSLTTNEVCRIQNALYRVEIVCMLYRIQPILYYWQRHLIRNFLARYNIWENEQISSIFEMFREAVGEGILLLASMDQLWMNYMDVVHRHCVHYGQREYYILKGLHFMQHLISSRSKQDLMHCLRPSPHGRTTTLRLDSVSDIDPRESHSQFEITQYAYHEEYNQRIQTPLLPDPDDGPEAMYIWAHPNLNDLHPTRHALRRSNGYVLWDRWRIARNLESPCAPQSCQTWERMNMTLAKQRLSYDNYRCSISCASLERYEENKRDFDGVVSVSVERETQAFTTGFERHSLAEWQCHRCTENAHESGLLATEAGKRDAWTRSYADHVRMNLEERYPTILKDLHLTFSPPEVASNDM